MFAHLCSDFKEKLNFVLTVILVEELDERDLESSLDINLHPKIIKICSNGGILLYGIIYVYLRINMNIFITLISHLSYIKKRLILKFNFLVIIFS